MWDRNFGKLVGKFLAGSHGKEAQRKTFDFLKQWFEHCGELGKIVETAFCDIPTKWEC